MKITPISSQWLVSGIKNKFQYSNNPITNNNTVKNNDIFVRTSSHSVSQPMPVHFMGHNVYLIDGGNHAKDMEHFAKAIDSGNNMTVYTYETQDPIYSKFGKPWQNVEEELQKLYYSERLKKDDYVAVPVYINVPLQNLEAQYKEVMKKDIDLKPYNVLTHKKELLEFLQELARDPKKHEKYIRYMDPQDRGLEYVSGIINVLNRLDCKKIYVPASHPHEASLRWMANERGNTPELTNYLATGYDKDGKVHGMLDEIKRNGWYDFNLLTLADVDVVNMKKSDGFTDHIFSAYDTIVNDGERGVYNLTPVRDEEGKILGYSFKDDKTNSYPVEEFPYNEDLQDISKFVGKSVDEVVADDEETECFRNALGEHRDMLQFADKLYPVWKVYSQEQLWNDKIYDKGDFVDYKMENFFRRNGDYKIIYPPGDVENSGRPSVKAMGGSSYSMFTAIKRDIDNQIFYERVKEDGVNLTNTIWSIVDDAEGLMRVGDYDRAEEGFTSSLRYIDMVGFDPSEQSFLRAYKGLADLKYNKGDYAGANGLYNFYLNNICKKLENSTPEYFISHESERKHIADIFLRLADIANRRGEYIPEQECRIAAQAIVPSSDLGYYIINRRAKGDNNIGDLIQNARR